MDKATVSDNIKNIRLKLGLSIIQMAEALGMTRQSYAKLERGEINYFSPHLDEVAKLGNVSPEELVLGYEPHPDPVRELGEAQESYRLQKQSMVDRYEEQLRLLRQEVEYLKEICNSRNQTINSLTQANDLLRQRIKELEKDD